MYDLPDLKGTVLGFIEKHAEQVFKTEGFHEMSEEALGTLIASHNLNIDEVDLIGFVREWATVNSVWEFQILSVWSGPLVNEYGKETVIIS